MYTRSTSRQDNYFDSDKLVETTESVCFDYCFPLKTHIKPNVLKQNVCTMYVRDYCD